MKKAENSPAETSRSRTIPDVTIIDLDRDDALLSEGKAEESKGWEGHTESQGSGDPLEQLPKKGFRPNIHIVLAATALIVIPLIIYRVMNWGSFISQEEIFSDGPGTYVDTLDNIVPLLDDEGGMIPMNTEDGLTIVVFGNAPFADDRDSEDNLANLIAGLADATVYNCSVSGSYLAAKSVNIRTDKYPMDVFSFYWLSLLANDYVMNPYHEEAIAAMGDAAPPEAWEVVETLKALDFDTVDAIIIMYDATDYLMGHLTTNDDNSFDPSSFTGNLTAGIDIFQKSHPNTRIIVLSPAYAFAVDENGEYVSSDVMRYGHDVLSTYSILEYGASYFMSVTFVDNLYGTITEDNAEEYLTDNLHLNISGRRVIADRAVDALFYFGG